MCSIVARLTWLDDMLRENLHKQGKRDIPYPVIEAFAKLKNSKSISRLVVDNAVSKLSEGKNIFFESSQVKTIVSELYQISCRKVLQSLGGQGYDKQSFVEKELRDATATSIYSGANEILYRLIAKSRLWKTIERAFYPFWTTKIISF